MKICIYGAGAIGGFMGAELGAAGADVSLIARGPHLAAMQKNGLTLIRGDTRSVSHPKATSDPAELGAQDVVIITLKAHSVPGVVDHMQPLLGPDTAVVTAVNGIPWWYFHGVDGPHRDKRLESVDPGNKQWDGIGPERAVGCVVYPATEVTEPGVIQHIEGDRFTLGEPDGSRSERVQALSKALISAGLKAPIRPRIRDEIWIKLWGNLSFNPISALTGDTLEGICNDPATVAVVRSMMVEAAEIAEALGVRLAIDVDKRIAGAKAVGAHKTSMLQDLELGRPMEIDALVSVVQELGHLTAKPTPMIDAVLALVKQRARLAGCYRDD
jgi:2-dehydropantoate 2-reductase